MTVHAQRHRARRGAAQRRDRRWGLAFVAPFAVIFITFLLIPLIYAFWLSLHTSTLSGGSQFAWFANYVRAFSDPLFLGGLGRVLLFALVLVPAEVLVALVAALLIDALTTRFAQVSRLIIFLPYAVPVAIGALMWGFLYSPNFGPLRDIFGSAAPDLFTQTGIFGALTNIVVWQYAGYFMIIIYAALQGIDPSIYEAAKLDGAGPIQTALRIKLPMVSSSITLVLLFAIIGALQFFTEPQVLMNVSNGVITPDFTPNLYAYSLAFKFNQIGYASTISFSLGLIVVACSLIFFAVTKKRSNR